MKFWRKWFAKAYTCAGCGKVEKCFRPQEKFDFILEDWSTRPKKKRFIFCSLNCIGKWLTK